MRKFFYKILLYITYFIAIALATSYLSVYINPQKVWWLAFMGLAFPYLLFANVISAILWLVSHRQKVVLIPLITLVLGWGHIGKVVQLSGRKSEISDSTSFNVLTYNVRAFNIYKWNESDSAANDIFKLINEKNPQVICFQEFAVNNKRGYSFTEIEKKLSGTPYTHYYGRHSTSNDFRGLAIYSAFPIVKRGVIPFTNTNNASIYCDILINSDTVRIYNNHLQSIKLAAEDYALIDTIKLQYNEQQMKGIKEISLRLRDAFIIRAKQGERIKEHSLESPYPVIICGDFNDTPISYTYHIVKKGLYDAFIESGRGIGNTYIGKVPSFRIDYILHSKMLESLKFECIKADYSDHYPLECSIRFKK